MSDLLVQRVINVRSLQDPDTRRWVARCSDPDFTGPEMATREEAQVAFEDSLFDTVKRIIERNGLDALFFPCHNYDDESALEPLVDSVATADSQIESKS